jgi:predicted RND superfamily exporter protein
MKQRKAEGGDHGFVVRAHDWVSHTFGSWGAFCARHPWIVLCVGLIFFAAISSGISLAEKENRLSEIWVEKGTRLRDEKAFYEAKFGGLRRTQALIFSNDKVSNMLDNTEGPRNVKAMIETIKPFITEDESVPGTMGPYIGDTQNTATATPIAMSVPNQVKLTRTSPARTFTEKDFCEGPAVPALLGYTPTQVAANTFFQIPGPGAFMFAKYTQCLASGSVRPFLNAGLFTPLGFPLPVRGLSTDYSTGAAWAIDRYPCTRTAMIDCFQDGGFDLPLRMKIAASWSPIALFMQNAIKNPATAGLAGYHLTCKNQAARETRDETLGGNNIYATTYASVNATFESLILPLIAGTGYWWRTPLSALTPGDPNFSTNFGDFVADADAYIADTTQDRVNCATSWLTQRFNPLGPTLIPIVPCCGAWSGTKITPELLFGGIQRDSSNRLTSFTAARLTVNNYNDDDPVFLAKLNAIDSSAFLDSDVRDELQGDFENIWIAELTKAWKKFPGSGFAAAETFEGISVSFSMDRTPGDVIREGTSGEVDLIIIGYAILFAYAAFSLSRLSFFSCSCERLVYSRMSLGLLGVLSVAIAIVASFGLTSFVGIKLSVTSINLVPFISLAIGVDDMFVIAHTQSFFNGAKDTVQDRMRSTMMISGPSVLLTSFANAIAFFIASLTPIPAVQTFVLQMGMSVLLNFLSLLLLFVPIVALDIHRTKQKRVDIICCSVQSQVCEEDDPAMEESGGAITKFAENVYAPMLTKMYCKLFVVVIFFTFFGAMTYVGFAKTSEGLRLSDIALRDSFLRDFVELNEEAFGAYDSYITFVDYDMTTQVNQQRVLDIMDNLMFSGKANRNTALPNNGYTGPFPLSTSMPIDGLAWFGRGSTSVVGFGATQGITIPTPSVPAWKGTFEGWAGSIGALSDPDLYCEDPSGVRKGCTDFSAAGGDKLDSHRIQVILRGIVTNDNFVDSIEYTRKWVDADRGDNNVFIYGYTFQYWEQYLNIKENLMAIIGWSLVGVFAAVLLLQFSPLASLLVVAVILMISIELYGMMYVIDANLNAFSLTNLAMAIGMAVEFTAHVTHVFLVNNVGDRNRRVQDAVTEMLPPMINGALSSFLAVIVLAFAEFPFFRTYYFGMFSIMIVVAFFNGMMLMPVLLSWFGPKAYHPKDEAEAETGGVAMKKLASTPNMDEDEF